MKLIDKAAVVEKLERLYNLEYYNTSDLSCGKKIMLRNILCFLNNLEIKEFDLEKEINKYISDNFFGSQTLGFFANRTKEEPNDRDIALVAKHFFEFGLSVNNPITAADRGMAEEIIINLKRVEQDYHIDLTKEMEWLRNKTRKEE